MFEFTHKERPAAVVLKLVKVLAVGGNEVREAVPLVFGDVAFLEEGALAFKENGPERDIFGNIFVAGLPIVLEGVGIDLLEQDFVILQLVLQFGDDFLPLLNVVYFQFFAAYFEFFVLDDSRIGSFHIIDHQKENRISLCIYIYALEKVFDAFLVQLLLRGVRLEQTFYFRIGNRRLPLNQFPLQPLRTRIIIFGMPILIKLRHC